MAVDKNLFLYNLSIVSIMKNEGPYAKEWIDYHLLAGVEHFFLYDNDSTDNMKEVLQPYIDAGIITYIFYPGKSRQMEAYIDAVHNFRFLSRFIAFIDADEFIFPQNNKTVVEVLDEIFDKNPDAAGLGVNIFNFGSNYQEKADYSKGLLERFTRRSATDLTPPDWKGNPGGTASVSTIANPRKIKVFHVPHCAQYFEGCNAINENGGIVQGYFNNPPTVDKIVMNHYSTKSREEYIIKVRRGNADHYKSLLDEKNFTHDTGNEVFDDSILKYRAYRMTETGGKVGRPINYQQIYSALMWHLSPTFSKNVPPEIFAGKMETFLTCRKVAEVLRERVLDETTGKFFEETALNAIHKTLSTALTLPDLRLLISELPKILQLDYPAVEEILKTCINVIPQMMHIFRINNIWGEFTELEYLLNMLKLLDSYESA